MRPSLLAGMMACAARMEAASPMTEKTLAARGRCNVIASGTPALYAVRL
jgi:hypothetical protein